MKKLLSIIIPVYNVEKYLHKCLDSILNQGFSDMEVILVEDGSPDSSGMICDEYASRYPSIVKVLHQKNKGASGARNAGIISACGRYIFFIDGDDTIFDTALVTIAGKLEEYDYPDMLIFDGIAIAEDGYIYPGRIGSILPSGNIPPRELISLRQTKELLLEFPSPCFRVTKREVIVDNLICFPEGLWFEDNAAILQMVACSQSIVYLDIPLYYYLQHQGSNTKSTDVQRRTSDIIRVFEITFEWFESKGLLDEYRAQLVLKALHELLVVQAITILLAGSYHENLDRLVNAVEKFDETFYLNPYLSQCGKKTQLKIRLLAKRQYKILSAALKLTTLAKRILKFARNLKQVQPATQSATHAFELRSADSEFMSQNS